VILRVTKLDWKIELVLAGQKAPNKGLGLLTQFWLFVTPIAYPSSLLSEPWRTFYGINPMTGVIQGFRWALLGSGDPPGVIFFVSIGIVLVGLVSGALCFAVSKGRWWISYE
jgi:ABC-type polysaccharide/polyol phosphate export permease